MTCGCHCLGLFFSNSEPGLAGSCERGELSELVMVAKAIFTWLMVSLMLLFCFSFLLWEEFPSTWAACLLRRCEGGGMPHITNKIKINSKNNFSNGSWSMYVWKQERILQANNAELQQRFPPQTFISAPHKECQSTAPLPLSTSWTQNLLLKETQFLPSAGRPGSGQSWWCSSWDN